MKRAAVAGHKPEFRDSRDNMLSPQWDGWPNSPKGRHRWPAARSEFLMTQSAGIEMRLKGSQSDTVVLEWHWPAKYWFEVTIM